jgi:hypothetical protein
LWHPYQALNFLEQQEIYDEWDLKSASGVRKDYLEDYNRIKSHYKKCGTDKMVFLRKKKGSVNFNMKEVPEVIERLTRLWLMTGGDDNILHRIAQVGYERKPRPLTNTDNQYPPAPKWTLAEEGPAPHLFPEEFMEELKTIPPPELALGGDSGNKVVAKKKADPSKWPDLVQGMSCVDFFVLEPSCNMLFDFSCS